MTYSSLARDLNGIDCETENLFLKGLNVWELDYLYLYVFIVFDFNGGRG
jgi:hypothetical protein